MIEHNLDVIKTADRIIDLGPEGGEEGGLIVAHGTPEQVAAKSASYTGGFLAQIVKPAPEAAAAQGRGRRLVSRRGRSALWWQKWRWYERNSLPWNRLAIHREFMRRGAFARWPVQGNVLEAFREGRLDVGEGVLLEPNAWLTAPGDARIRIGAGSFLNIGVMVASVGLVDIGDHCMFANGCFVTDGEPPLR